MDRLIRCAVLVLAGVLAGCLSPGAADDASALDEQALLVGPDPLTFTDCVALQATAHAPGAIGPADRPPGWPPRSLEDLPNVVVQALALRCSRVNVGPFERGPIHAVLEWHGDAQAPAACLKDSRSGSRVLATALLDDPEVVEYLRLKHGLPAQVATVIEDESGLGLAQLHTWTLQVGQGPASEVRVEGDAAFAAEEWRWTLFWAAGDGLGRLDVDWSGNGSTLLRPAQGVFHPPMLLARMPEGTFAGTGQWFPRLDGQGAIAHYRDAGCREPLP